MTWRLGLRASIALTVVLVTTLAAAVMALVTYQLQTGPTRDRYIGAATVNFLYDARQLSEQVNAATVATKIDVNKFRDYKLTRPGIIWAVLTAKVDSSPGGSISRDAAPGDEKFVVTAGNSSLLVSQLSLPEADMVQSAVSLARRSPQPVTRIVNTKLGPKLIIVGQLGPGLLFAEAFDTHQLDSELSTLRLQLDGIAAGAALLGVLIGVVAAGRIQRRVRTAAVAARKLGDGALDTRLPVRGRDELADLASSFNAMAQRLSESIQQLQVNDQRQRRFIADVAHDLRTPLASMIAAAASLNAKDTDDRVRSAELVSSQVQRLSSLVEDLLEMSRFDAGWPSCGRSPSTWNPLAADAVALSAPEAGIQVAVTGDATIVGDPRRLHTIVRNLVTNADRHGARPITVTIDGSAVDLVRVAVADSGPGLPADLAPFVFDRFARGDRARQKTEGSGLGLAIAYENAALHGGRLEVANSAGAVFTLTVPRGTAADSGPVPENPPTS
ncbi:sensor histidine kinase [Fodinicola feengrottensis]|uniref:sensor histidine kinase n=1 Tax=Fodinicola feengrottensis TaxID=435914 RepID=UPI0013D533F8|nr:HAMP domain-containing sensor histidine kinase [Fodinicola feengrottensis]